MPSLSLEVGVNRIAEHIKKGQCILFLGAGVHSPPPTGSPYSYSDEQRPPLGGDLSVRLCGKSNYLADYPKGNPRNLAQVALYFEWEKKRKALIDEIRDAVSTGKVPSPALRALAKLNFPLVITTNYDGLFEMALAQLQKQPVKKVYEKSRQAEAKDFPGEPTALFPFLFKIHGDLLLDPDSVVITDEDYIPFMMRMGDASTHNPVPETLLFRFKKYATLFIGYSLLDYNLRLLFKTLQWRLDPAERPETYSVDPFPDKLIHEVYGLTGQLVNFIVEDVWKFVPMLYKALEGQDMPQ
jgi:hypothetical protein